VNGYDSTTYQLILHRGEARGAISEAKSLILLMSEMRFGPIPAAMRTVVEGITDLTRLESVADRLLDATDWDELLTPIALRFTRPD
jgi:hypothetical protein